MDETNYTTEHRKGQHLTSEEWHIIEVRFNKDKRSIYGIAKELGRPYNTVKNEIMRGTVSLYTGKVKRYKADVGYSVYLEHRQECRRKYRCLETAAFLQYVTRHFRKDKWSLDACACRAVADGTFQREKTVCTKTLYRYVDLGLLPIKNMTCRKSSVEIPSSTKPEKTREILEKASKNDRKPLIYGKNSGIGRSTAFSAKRMKTNLPLFLCKLQLAITIYILFSPSLSSWSPVLQGDGRFPRCRSRAAGRRPPCPD